MPSQIKLEPNYEEKNIRYKDAPWFGKFYPITIGGAGATGSHIAMILSRYGHQLTIWDNDSVDTVNLGAQGYHMKHLGMPKVDAIKELCASFSGEDNVTAKNELFTEDSPIESICFSCFDSMKARKDMFESWVQEAITNDGSTPCVFIDGRILYGTMDIFIVTKDTIDEYRKSLFDDSEGVDGSCTLKITTHYAYLISAYMVNSFTNYLTNFVYKKPICPLPNLKLEMISMYYDISK